MLYTLFGLTIISYISLIFKVCHNSVILVGMIQSDIHTKMMCRRKSEQVYLCSFSQLLTCSAFSGTSTKKRSRVSFVQWSAYTSFNERCAVQSFSSSTIIQYCQQRLFQESTLYFAKIYLKRFLVESRGIDGLNLKLVLLTSIWIAVKVKISLPSATSPLPKEMHSLQIF